MIQKDEHVDIDSTNDDQKNNINKNGSQEILVENLGEKEQSDKEKIKVSQEKKEEEEKKKVQYGQKIVEKLEKASKEDVIKEYIKLLQKNEKLKKFSHEKETESSEYLDRYRRTLAEMENLRKRTVINKQDSLKYANFNIISDLLVILDDFQRAIDAARSDKKMNLKHFVDGIDMIEKQFVDLLFKKYGVVKYGKNGDDFDPKIHLAMVAGEGDFTKEVVLEVFRKGYLLHDRVIRAAQVKVSKLKQK